MLLLFFYLGCASNSQTYNSAFMSRKENKSSLLKNGFRRPRSNTLVNNSPPHIDCLLKSINDTLVAYNFNEDNLTSIDIQVRLNNYDTSSIFQLLNRLGFERSNSNNSFAFVNKDANIRYEVTGNSKYLSFVHSYTKGTASPAMPLDTARMAR